MVAHLPRHAKQSGAADDSEGHYTSVMACALEADTALFALAHMRRHKLTAGCTSGTSTRTCGIATITSVAAKQNSVVAAAACLVAALGQRRALAAYRKGQVNERICGASTAANG